MEIELDEERSSVELLNDRIARSRDQVPHKNIWIHMQINRSHFYVTIDLITGSLTLPPHSPLRWISFVQSWCRSVLQDTTWRWTRVHLRDRYPVIYPVPGQTHKHTHIHKVRIAFLQNQLLTVPLPFPGEGVEVSCGRHGGTDPALGWNQPAGKQNSRVRGETSQRRKVWSKTKWQLYI